MKHKHWIWPTLLILLAALGVEPVRAARRETQPATENEGTCAAYGITFDATSIETLYLEPDKALAAPETFYETDPAYRILTNRAGASNLNPWKRKLRRIERLSPERREKEAPLRFARSLLAKQETFCATAVPHVLSYLPEGIDLQDTTIYLTALEHPVTGQTHRGHVVLPLSSPMYRNAERIFGQGSSTVSNILAHELTHRGYDKTRALRREHTWEESIVQDLIEDLQNEGLAVLVAYRLRNRYPSSIDLTYPSLQSELRARTLVAKLNRLLDRADSMEPARLWQQVARFCDGRQHAYVVGGYMARTIEEQLGKAALVQTLTESPAAFVRTYNSVAKPGMAVAYDPPPVPEGSLFVQLREAALSGDPAAVEARLAAVEAAQAEPSEFEVYTLFRTGELLLDQRHTAQAIRAFQQVIVYRPKLGAGYLGLGECYLATGQHELARPALEQGLELDPRAAWAALLLQEIA